MFGLKDMSQKLTKPVDILAQINVPYARQRLTKIWSVIFTGKRNVPGDLIHQHLLIDGIAVVSRSFPMVMMQPLSLLPASSLDPRPLGFAFFRPESSPAFYRFTHGSNPITRNALGRAHIPPTRPHSEVGHDKTSNSALNLLTEFYQYHYSNSYICSVSTVERNSSQAAVLDSIGSVDSTNMRSRIKLAVRAENTEEADDEMECLFVNRLKCKRQPQRSRRERLSYEWIYFTAEIAYGTCSTENDRRNYSSTNHLR
ncbi:hypothetical protein CBL_11020 [Carabus blaptoides fortunei]